MHLSHFKKALGVGAAILIATSGSAFAATILTADTDLMSGPGSSTKIIGRLQADSNVAVSQTQGDWCLLTAPSKGWVACTNIDGLPGARVNAAPAAPTGYDFNADPNFGPAAQGGLHTVTNGSFS
jgi:uncharacterized protein YraI